MPIIDYLIRRPILSSVFSIAVVIAGLMTLQVMPVSEYPDVSPPTIEVSAFYPGANPNVISETVASLLEDEIIGVKDMLYVSSQATADGRLSMYITFDLNTDMDAALTNVQNRVSQALPRLPQEVVQFGVTTKKTVSDLDLTMVVHITSPNDRYGTLYLTNYATLNIKDHLLRVDGIGNILVFGAGDYSLRVWLNPERATALGITTQEILHAIRQQNKTIAAGAIASPPSDSQSDFQLLVNVEGRLGSTEEFEQIIVRREEGGGTVRLGQVAKVELGSSSYSLRSMLDNKETAALSIFQRTGSNSLDISREVRDIMADLEDSFPEGVSYEIVYDPTEFVRESISEVMYTLMVAMLLVVLVVVAFLKTWRASIVPLIAIPISLIGSLTVMHLMGFTINSLSLFGLVLAIGVVVDDAIVVVENIERHIRMGKGNVKATSDAMKEVVGPIISTTLVLLAVFVPTAFVGNLSGQFYHQFALTITVSTVISTIVSLTLSPALSALLLPSADKQMAQDLPEQNSAIRSRFMVPVRRFKNALASLYRRILMRSLSLRWLCALVYVGILASMVYGFYIVPKGYVPFQDKDYLVSFMQLPDGASLDRAQDVIERMTEVALEHPDVTSVVGFPGLSINFVNATNAGVVFVGLKSIADRSSAESTSAKISADIAAEYRGIQEAFTAIFPPAPVPGVGVIGGFRLQIEDRANLGYAQLYQHTQNVLYKAWSAPELKDVYSSYSVNVPQIQVEVDKDKAFAHNVRLEDVYETLQVYLGSLYVNDFNLFGRTYQVTVQAAEEFRRASDQIRQLHVKNGDGDMVSLGSLVSISHTAGPDYVTRYNGYASSDINGVPAPGYSSAQAIAAIERIVKAELPRGMSYEWTGLSYQQTQESYSWVYILVLVIVLVYVVLAAHYESLRLPLVVILTVPLALFAAVFGVYLWQGENNIMSQIGFVLLIALAAKNAILIVEFAKTRQLGGEAAGDAVVNAALLRLRPILMTSTSFIMGVVPLVFSTGAGAEMRQSLGIVVFSGMIGVTLFSLLFTPVFYFSLAAKAKRVHPTHHQSDLAAALS